MAAGLVFLSFSAGSPSDKDLEKLVVLVDVLVDDLVGVHPVYESLEVLLRFDLDTYECRTFFLVRFLDVLEEYQIILRAEIVPDE